MTEEHNDEYLEPVSHRINKAIIDFARLREGSTFHADDLRQHVLNAVGPTAPASADRILRDLRQRGRIQYRCIHRRQSLYFIDGVAA